MKDMIRIHMDDQMDSKTLLGSYICTDVPGEFRWHPGALTQVIFLFPDLEKKFQKESYLSYFFNFFSELKFLFG